MNDIGFMCCFCDKNIESTNVDPCDLNILINLDKSKEYQDNQTFYCHIECFREKLHKNIHNYLVVRMVDEIK